MLADYQEIVGPIDKRLKIAEFTSQARSVCTAGDGSTSKSTAGDIEALDWFMAAVTDEKLLQNEGRTMIAIARMGKVRERGSSGKAGQSAPSK